MKYKEIRDLLIKESNNNNYEEILKGIISYEKDIKNEKVLTRIYDNYMRSDCSIFSDEMEDIIEEAIEYFDENVKVEKESD